MLTQLKQQDIKELRQKLWQNNNQICPLLGTRVPLEKIVLDHIHKTSSEALSTNKGTVRNAIEFRANALEGKITNAFRRYFGADESKHPITLPNYLRNLADYIEADAYSENGEYFIHPTEKKKESIVSKRNYNILKKKYTGSIRFPEYPKSKKLTNRLKELFIAYDIEPYN